MACNKGERRVSPKGTLLNGYYDQTYCTFPICQENSEECPLEERITNLLETFSSRADVSIECAKKLSELVTKSQAAPVCIGQNKVPIIYIMLNYLFRLVLSSAYQPHTCPYRFTKQMSGSFMASAIHFESPAAILGRSFLSNAQRITTVIGPLGT